ncbi:MAG TPA: discoidin domain-containing protein [bacterium]|nr:discoidin domain-containing protein [bacterium]
MNKKILLVFLIFCLSHLIYSEEKMINFAKEEGVSYKVSVGHYFDVPQYGKKRDNDLIRYRVGIVEGNIIKDKEGKVIGEIINNKDGVIEIDFKEKKGYIKFSIEKSSDKISNLGKQELNILDEKNNVIGKASIKKDGEIDKIYYIVNEDGDFEERKGLLTDGRDSYAPNTGLCYVFWRVPGDDSFITIDFDLKKPRKITNVVLKGQNLSPMFGVSKSVLYSSKDGIVYEIKKVIEKVEPPKTVNWNIEFTDLNINERYIRITTWALENKWLNLTEVEIFGKE